MPQKNVHEITHCRDEITPENNSAIFRAGEVAANIQIIDNGTDAILDEIDEALEENAEEFIKNFVQQGGQ